MKRIAAGMACLFILIGGFVAALPFFVSSDAVRSNIIARVEALTGRKADFQGNPNVSFIPFLGVEISNLVISDPKAVEGASPLLQVDQVQARLDFLPALLGQVNISEYRLVRPKLNLKIYADGLANWHFDKGALHETITNSETSDQENPDRSTQLGVFLIEDGRIHYEDTIAGASEDITNVSGTFSWPETGKVFRTNGSAIWRSENIDLNNEIENLPALLNGGTSQLSVDFRSKPLNVKINGKANMIADLFIKGEIAASSPSLERLSEFIKLDLGQTGAPGEWAINGQIEGTVNSATVTDATVSMAGYKGSGTVTIALDELRKTNIDGTLAFDQIDASSYFFNDVTPSTIEANTHSFNNLDIDLRLSANRITLGKLEINNVAAAVDMQAEGWIFDIGYSEALGGTIIAKIGERNEAEKHQAFLELAARDLDASQVSLLVPDRLLTFSGKTNINANLRTNTVSQGFLSKGLNGTLEAIVTNGTIEGIDLQNLLQPGSENVDRAIGNGSTKFEELNFGTFLNNGTIAISKSHVQLPGMRVQFIGDINLLDNGMALRAQEITDTGPKAERLFIGGTLNNPLVSIQKSPPKPATETSPIPEQPEAPAAVESN